MNSQVETRNPETPKASGAPENGAPMTTLVGEIMHDAQELMRQQFTLFQVELKNDLRRTRNAAIPLSVGLVVSLLAVVLLCAMLALLISEQLTLPFWAGFAIVGGVLLIVGGGLTWWGKTKFDAFNPLPDQSLEGLKETIQWKTKP
jgi:uncharacterized membrane protein YqjE